jgi:serine/threonine protein kinase
LKKYYKTYRYLAPEVLMGGPHTYESDLWSLGCVVIEMLTGRSVWYDKDKNQKETVRDLINDIK